MFGRKYLGVGEGPGVLLVVPVVGLGEVIPPVARVFERVLGPGTAPGS